MKKLIVMSAMAALFALPAPSVAATFFSKASYDGANVTDNSVTFGGIAPAGGFTSVANPFNIGNVSITSIANSVSSSTFFFNTPVDSFFVDSFSSPATFTFNAPVNAFGFTLANGFNGGNISADVFNGAALLGNFVFAANNQNAFDSFFGVNDLGSITSVNLTPQNGGFLLVSEIQSSVGVGAVPEPATWAFMIFGFGAIGGAMRRQRKANVKVSYA